MRKKLLTKNQFIILFFVLVKMTLHLLYQTHSGLDGDEIMHIDSGHHLAWGYISIQPLIGLLSWIQNNLSIQNLFVHHLFCHISSALIIIYSGRLVLLLGGNWRALLLSLTCIIVSPGFSVSGYIFTPLVFEQLFWMLSFYSFVKYSKTQQLQYLTYTALFLGIGFMSKLSILLLVAGIGLSLIINQRKIFTQIRAWGILLLFLLLISPNIYWQIQHHFPALQHMSTLYSEVLLKLHWSDNLLLLLITSNPFVLFICVLAFFVAPFLNSLRPFRTAITAPLITFILLLLFRGQFHYFFPSLLIALPIASVLIQKHSRTPFIYLYIAILIASGIYLLPRFTPLLPLKQYISLHHLEGNKDKNKQLFFTQQSIADNQTENTQRIPINFESYYTHNDWENLAQGVHELYQQLSEEEQKHCYIWTRCYTQAGALNLYGKKYHLPTAFSQHGVYSEWIPPLKPDATLIIVANATHPSDSIGIGSFFQPAFKKVIWKKGLYCPYARQNSNTYFMLYLGKGLKYNTEDLKVKYKDYVFE